MSELSNWTKKNTLLFIIIMVSALCIIMLIIYFLVFDGNLSSNSSEWGDFGDYFGSITGLIAFLGVLYTIRLSKDQAKANEERGVFFKMLELYQNQVNDIELFGVKGTKVFEITVKELTTKTEVSIINYVFLNSKKFGLDLYNDPPLLALKLAESNSVCMNDWENKKDVIIEATKDQIIKNRKRRKINIPKDFKVNYYEYSFYLERFISFTNNSNRFNIIYRIYRESFDALYSKNGYYLDQYFRNIYNLLNIISGFQNKELFCNILKTQVSNSEIITLFYYSLSKQTNKKFTKLLLEFNLFEYINVMSTYFLDPSCISESVNNNIRKVLNIYLNDPNNPKD